MQIGIGNRIKELRRRDGRTQEDLANALGVTCQAISRWEANGGYPDMETVPAIANYFHVTIDELFGYNGDREERITKILEQADRGINSGGDVTECVNMLRKAVEEFPSEPQVLLRLGYALNLCGWQKHGARGYTKDSSDYLYEDIEYNAKNAYWQEATMVFEKLLTMELPNDDREAIILCMTANYDKMGEREKAKALAENQNSLIISRECLLPHAMEGEDRDRYLGEAIIALLNELKKYIEVAVSTKLSIATTEIGINKFMALARLYEEIFDDGKCGIAHIHLRDLYLYCSIYQARLGDIDKALEYFSIAFGHSKTYSSIRCKGTYQYTAPLVSKVTFPGENFPAIPENYWEGWINVIPTNLREAINADERYKECFE